MIMGRLWKLLDGTGSGCRTALAASESELKRQRLHLEFEHHSDWTFARWRPYHWDQCRAVLSAFRARAGRASQPEVTVPCRANSRSQSRFGLLYCSQSWHLPLPCTDSGTLSTLGMVTASCPAIINRQTIVFPCIVRRNRSAGLRILHLATGMAAAGTISASHTFSTAAGMAAVSVPAGLTRLSG